MWRLLIIFLALSLFTAGQLTIPLRQSSKFDTAFCKPFFYYHCFVRELLFIAQINKGFSDYFSNGNVYNCVYRITRITPIQTFLTHKHHISKTFRKVFDPFKHCSHLQIFNVLSFFPSSKLSWSLSSYSSDSSFPEH